ncbi:MAG: RNase J family beta-CASP ribonuclease [Halobacteria archaeon]|nr:RNase J family beta-CASP ribonuclease [Halobacteria archaeon]
MEIEVAAVGGYEEVGKQMTAVRVDDDVIIFDMGIDLSKILIHDDVETETMHSLDLIDMGAIPDDRIMSDVQGDVKAIIPTHGHLDHIAAIPKLAHRYDAPIIASPFTAELVKRQIKGERKFGFDNSIRKMKAGEVIQINDEVTVEFVNTQHSIPDAIIPVVHTPEGSIVYGLDMKIDYTPVIGEPTNVKRFKEIGQEGAGTLALIPECINAGEHGRTPSEKIAREMVRDVLYSMEDHDGGIVATTFASHIARIKTLIEFSQEIGRRPVLLGRSMEKYSGIAERMDLVDFEDVGMFGHRRSIDRTVKRIMKEGKSDYLPIVTGHQGEPRAMLTRMARSETPYEIEDGDRVIYSARVIPSPINQGQRHQAEKLLRMQGARVYSDIHVSGHMGGDEHYDLVDWLQPKHIVPAHQTMAERSKYVDMAENLGYEMGRDVHLLRNGDRIQLTE